MACRLSTHSEGDSDSDWDDDDDFASKKITIKIKPIAQITPNKISASVDELRATVGTWKSLANINLVKPNSRRHIQHSNIRVENTKLPVAFAIQECLNAKLYKTNNNNTPNATVNYNYNNGINSNNNNNNNNGSVNGFTNHTSTKNSNQVSLIGRLKMAVPPKLVTMDSSTLDRFLEFELMTSIPWDYIRLNEEFVRECDDGSITPNNNNNNNNNNHLKILNTQQFLMNQHKQPFASSSSSSSLSSANHQPNKRFLINMESVQAYVKQLHQKQPDNKYFLVPELLSYSIGSQNNQDNNFSININNNINSNIDYNHLSTSSSSSIVGDVSARLSPLNVLAHWLCDLTITKVRIDIQFLENTIDNLNLSPNDVRNLKISLVVNGGVVSYQSKPEANWDAVNSKLTWSFNNLTELIQKSTSNGLASCLARLDLNDGPSTPSDVKIEFSICGKTLTGTHVILNGANFCIAKQKYEVRTGTFMCRE